MGDTRDPLPGITIRLDPEAFDRFGQQLRTIIHTLTQAGLEDTARMIREQAEKISLTATIRWEAPHE